MDTTVSWRLLSPASSPPCLLQIPKRKATFAALPPHSARSKFRFPCLLHDKDRYRHSNKVVLVYLEAERREGRTEARLEAVPRPSTVTTLPHLDKVRHGHAYRANRSEASLPLPPMETTASWRLLSPGSSSPPAVPQLRKRPSNFAASPQQSANTKFRVLCLLHDKQPAPAAENSQLQRLAAALQWGAVWAAVEAPAALAVTGEEDIDLGILPPLAAFAVFYLFVAPPLIMNWMRVRWYKRKFVETYLQFMFTYLFFPGMMLWAPFVNFRKFPRDPTMKYPWSTPKEGTPLFKDRYPPIDSPIDS